MKANIYHNAKCSKSCATLAILQEKLTDKNASISIIDYLSNPPSESELLTLVEVMGLSVRDIIRTGEPEYARLELANKNLDDEALLSILVSHPILIERPIVQTKFGVVIGRPPEKVLDILV